MELDGTSVSCGQRRPPFETSCDFTGKTLMENVGCP